MTRLAFAFDTEKCEVVKVEYEIPPYERIGGIPYIRPDVYTVTINGHEGATKVTLTVKGECTEGSLILKMLRAVEELSPS